MGELGRGWQGWGSECPTSAAETGKAGKVGSAAKMQNPKYRPSRGRPGRGELRLGPQR